MRIAINGDFGVQTVQIAVGFDNQRIDFQQSQIVINKQFSKPHKDLGELLDLVTGQTQLERQITALIRLWAYQWIHSGFQNFLGRIVSNFLDLDTTFSGRHKHNTTGERSTTAPRYSSLAISVQDSTRILIYRLAIGISLVSHQALSQPLAANALASSRFDNELDPTSLAATTGMHLSLYDPHIAADLVTGLCRSFRCIHRETLGNRQAVLSKQLLSLILV
jgi:hypothetical protein